MKRIICAKKCPPSCKKKAGGSRGIPLRNRPCAGAYNINLARSRGRRGERKLFHPAAPRLTPQGTISTSGRKLLAEVSICRDGRDFSVTVVQQQNPDQVLIKGSFLHISSSTSLANRSQALDSELGREGKVVAPCTQSSQESNLLVGKGF